MSVQQAGFSESSHDGASPPSPRPVGGAVEGLSNDYLNHFSEPLMLIELAALDSAVISDLNEWRPVDYPRYFQNSQLRRAPEARAAYWRLEPGRRAAFEQLVCAMDQLVATAIRALRPPCEPEDAALVAAVTAPAMRRLIGQASAFLNSGGRDLPDSSEVEEAQSVIDRLLERLAAG